MQNNEFIKTYVGFLRPFLVPALPLKIVFDFSNGATELIVPEVVKGTPSIKPIFVDRTLSGNFPAHGPNPLAPKAIGHIHKEVLMHHADLGVIFDADGDRVFFIDHLGRWIPTHVIAYLLAIGAHPPYVFDTRTALSLKKSGLIPPGQVHVSPVGSIFIKEAMRRTHAGLGAEYSGHYCFEEFYMSDSGILTALKIINAITLLPYTVADLVDLAPVKLETEEINIESGDPGQTIAAVLSHYRGSALSLERRDGATLDFGSWFLNIRSSNTESLVRVFAGSSDRALLARKTKEFREQFGTKTV